MQLGVSVEDQDTADQRVPVLLNTPAAARWLSAEPLLGPIDLTRLRPPSVTWMDCLEGREHFGPGVASGGPHLDWVVVGGESGPGARPMHPDWVRSIRDQCRASNVPFFFKQWGAFADTWTDKSVMVEDVKPNNRRLMTRVGKKAAGNLLDGRQHLEYPA